jgi:hypothetical protein
MQSSNVTIAEIEEMLREYYEARHPEMVAWLLSAPDSEDTDDE